MISVGVIVEQGLEEVIYCINTLLGQTYKKIEIIISIYEGIDVSIYDILECIRQNRRDNIVSVQIIDRKIGVPFKEQLETIIDSSNGKGLCFISSKNALYDNNALEYMQAKLTEEVIIAYGQTIVFDKDGNYIGNSEVKDISKTILSFDRIIEDFSENRACLYNRTKLQEMISVGGQVSGEVVKCDTPFLRYKKIERGSEEEWINDAREGQDLQLNFTDAAYLKALLQQTITGELKKDDLQEEVENIKSYIIGKQRGGVWELTDSDKVLIKFLDNMLLMHEHPIFLSWKLKRLLKEIDKYRFPKVKIAILVHEPSLWISVKSVYDSAQKDERFSVELIHVPFEHVRKKTSATDELNFYRKAGYPIKAYSEYDISKESPDIIIYMKPYDSVPEKFLIRNIDKVVRRCVYIRYAPYSNIVMNSKVEELFFSLPFYFVMWKGVSFNKGEMDKARNCSWRGGKEWWPLGHPREDFKMEDFTEDERNYIEELKKWARGRKIFLWNTSHIMKDTELPPPGTFLEWGECILRTFEQNSNICLLWRPHPLFFSALEEIWGREQVESFRKRVLEKENVYIDDQSQYLMAMWVSDALISDASSLIDLYLPTLKPILMTKSKKYGVSSFDKKFINSIQVLCTQRDAEEFINEVTDIVNCNREDKSKLVIENYFSFSHKKSVAETLLDKIIEEIEKEESVCFTKRKVTTGCRKFL